MSKKQAGSTAVAEQHTAVAVALGSNFENDAASGFEGADAAAYAIPFLSILQSMSPQCKKSDGAYIPGAEEGVFFNSVTRELVDGAEGVTVVPCYYKRSFIRWAPRSSGGGFKGEYTPAEAMVGVMPGLRDFGGTLFVDVPAGETPFDAQGKPRFDFLADTRTHYVLVVDADGGYQPAVISLSSTQIKKSRQWMSKMNGIKMRRANGTQFTPPMFSHLYKLTTVPESNDKGSWFGLKVELEGVVESAELYAAAKAFRDAVVSGEAKEQVPHADGGEAAGEAGEDENILF